MGTGRSRTYCLVLAQTDQLPWLLSLLLVNNCELGADGPTSAWVKSVRLWKTGDGYRERCPRMGAWINRSASGHAGKNPADCHALCRKVASVIVIGWCLMFSTHPSRHRCRAQHSRAGSSWRLWCRGRQELVTGGQHTHHSSCVNKVALGMQLWYLGLSLRAALFIWRFPL